LALVFVIAAIGGLVGFPLWELARGMVAEGGAGLRDVLTSRELRQPALRTLAVGATVTVLTLVAAVSLVLVVERSPRRLRRRLRVAVLAPLLIPPFVSALSWVAAYGEGGMLSDLAGVRLPGLFGAFGVVLVITVNAIPLAYLVIAAALATRADADLECAARMSGAGPGVVLRTVTLPAIRPAIVGAGALVFVVAVNAFGIPAVLGTPAGFTTITTRIYQDLAFSADPEAFTRVLVMAGMLVIATFLVVGGADAASAGRGRPTHRVESPGSFQAERRRGGPSATLVAGYAVLVSGVPLVGLILTALTRAVGLAPTPGNWTTDNFAEAWSAGAGRALGNSLAISALAAFTVLALAGALVLADRRRAATPLGTVAGLTFAVPGSALAVAVLLAYGPWLRDTVGLILVAYLAKFWALGHRPLAGAVTSLAPDPIRAARVSGAGPAAAFRTVVLPVLAPALAAAWLLVFLFGLHELTMSSLLYGPDTATLAVVTLNLQQLGDPTVSSALAVILTGIVLGAAVPLGWVWRGWSRMGSR
jgi:iron(III) transport system permease protein